MAQQVFVEDNSIGNALAKFMGGSDPALAHLRGLQARQLRDQLDYAEQYNTNFGKYVDGLQPPSVPLPQGWQGPPSPATPQEAQAFDTQKQLWKSTGALGASRATSFSDVARGAPAVLGQTNFALKPPQTPQELLAANVQIEGKVPDVLFDPAKNQISPAKAATDMQMHEAKVGRGLPTSDEEDRAYEFNLNYLNGIKAKVGENQTSYARETQLSPAAQAAMARIEQKRVLAAEQQAQQQQQQQQPQLQPAPVSGPGSGVTVATPQQAPVLPPTTPQQAQQQRPAVAGQQVIRGPDGQPITIQRTGDPKPSTGEQAKTATATESAQNERLSIENMIGVQRDDKGNMFIPPTGQMNIPGGASSWMARQGEYGQSIGQWMDQRGRPPGQETQVTEWNGATERWIETAVRLVSGAVVSDTERASYRRMFIPNASDSPKVIKEKLEAMRLWEVAHASSANAAEAIQKMNQVAVGSPIIRNQITAIYQKAANAGTLNAPYQRQAPAAAEDYSDVNRLIGG